MNQTRQIYCCGCGDKVEARLTTGAEIYPHRGDLRRLPFWKCDTCRNYVGCHYKTTTPTNPLGNIPTKELRTARMHIHKVLDPIWKQKRAKRNEIYSYLTEHMGFKYHTASLRTVDEARSAYRYVLQFIAERGI